MIAEVCHIIGHHHHPGPEESINYKSVYDADMIANLEDNHKESPAEPEKLASIIEKSFLTESSSNLARQILLQ